MKLIKTSLFFLVLAFSTTNHAATVENIRVWHSPESTRLVFDLNKPFKHSVFEIKDKSKLVIDISKSQYNKTFKQSKLANSVIKKLRVGNHNKYVRIVLDLKRPITYRHFSLDPNERYGHRLVVDVFDSQPKVTTNNDTTISVNELVDNNRDIIIAIDAGHGGEDPGALGPNKAREKDIVLKISKVLKTLIDNTVGYKAKLVRNGDYFIKLSNRFNKARAYRADLFLSIHADAFDDPRASGASIYALSLRGATSASARYLAQRENRSDLIGGVSEVSLKDKDKQVAQVLLDLSMAATLETSLKIGTDILAQMGRVTKLHKRQVEQANFLVLKSPDVPSLLIETGFISNPKEAKQLSSSSFRYKLAKRIFDGIQNYYDKHPPAGTLVYNKIHNKKTKSSVVVVRRGDTLSEIAERNSVSVGAIRRHNKLKNDLIKIGQKLKIP